ncbi:hypothetical protein GCM10027596_33330 [Nocardioides korecus]
MTADPAPVARPAVASDDVADPVLAEVEAALGAQLVPDQPGPAPDPTEHEETR